MPRERQPGLTGLIPVGNRQITNYSSALVKRGLETLARTRSRAVTFPANRSIGDLYLIDSSQEWWKILQPVSFGAGKYFSKAQGIISVPQEKWLILNMRPFPINVSALRNLDPQDLHGLVIGSLENLIDLAPVGLLTGLKVLDLGFCATNTSYGFLKKLRALEALRINLQKDNIRGQDIETISGMPRLRKLDINLGAFNRFNVGKLAKGELLNLDLLSISGDFDDDQFLSLTTMESIKTLSLRNSLLTDSALPRLSALKILNRLVLDSSRITDVGAGNLSNLSHLESLTLFSPAVTDKGLKSLSKLTGLKRLRLRCSIDDEGLGYLSGMTQLTKLVLKSNLITDAGLFKLSHNPCLKVIEMYNTSVTEDGIRRFAESTNIKVTVAS
jgi:Leucine-rich repeat (LRR) protein